LNLKGETQKKSHSNTFFSIFMAILGLGVYAGPTQNTSFLSPLPHSKKISYERQLNNSKNNNSTHRVSMEETM